MRVIETLTAAVVGCLVTLALLLPTVADLRRERDGLKDNERRIAKRCVIYEDGSAVCPDGVFDVSQPFGTTTTMIVRRPR